MGNQMAKAYTKEFLIDVYMSRFEGIELDLRLELEYNAERYYDLVGKDEFRTASSVDAEAIKRYKVTH